MPPPGACPVHDGALSRAGLPPKVRAGGQKVGGPAVEAQLAAQPPEAVGLGGTPDRRFRKTATECYSRPGAVGELRCDATTGCNPM